MLGSNVEVGSCNNLNRWIRSELDLGRAINIPKIGTVSMQTLNEDLVVYFEFCASFFEEANMEYQAVYNWI